MYYPYIRGRQYDLLALKELARDDLISENVVPVIEPIKASSTFKDTLNIYKSKNLPIAVILNPQVVDLLDDDEHIVFENCMHGVIPALIIEDGVDEVVKKTGIMDSGSSFLAVLNNRDKIELYKELSERYTLMPTMISEERQIRRQVGSNRVLLEDCFNRQERNSDYNKNEDEFFSDSHLFYKEEGYIGFGDYSIIGEKYDDKGFTPRAVAIHIVYFDDSNELRVRHFVSDSNYGVEDVAGKFYEAVIKMKAWVDGNKIPSTKGLRTLMEFANKGYYPGLPTIKKLSIMHHIELMNNYLNGVL